jgi:hypothetical protein
MGLLEDALNAAGGLDRWRGLRRFTVHLSIKGDLLARNGKAGLLYEVVAEGCTQAQSLRLTGFIAPNKRGTYRPDRVAIENFDGGLLQERNNPRAAFLNRAGRASWDDLDFTYFFGFSLWNYLTAPFLLVLPDVATEELPIWREQGETWRRLKVIMPPSIATHSPEQTFYFDGSGLLRRMDYYAIDADGVQIAHYSSAHQRFSGIVVATLRRSMKLRPDGSVIEKPSSVDIEIFDASFE